MEVTQGGEALSTQEHKTYQELVGALLYLATCTLPDIFLVVGRLSWLMRAPTNQHLAVTKRVLRYLKGAADLGLTYNNAMPLAGFHDSDYTSDVDPRRSTTG